MAQLEPGARVIVTDVDMPFGSMVQFMVKWAIATIPALFLLSVIAFLVFGMLTAVFM